MDADFEVRIDEDARVILPKTLAEQGVVRAGLVTTRCVGGSIVLIGTMLKSIRSVATSICGLQVGGCSLVTWLHRPCRGRRICCARRVTCMVG